MSTLIMLAVLISTDAKVPAAAADPAVPVNLFREDGEPKGWTVREWNDLAKVVEDSPWSVRDGVLTSGSRRGTWLVSQAEYENFVLE